MHPTSKLVGSIIDSVTVKIEVWSNANLPFVSGSVPTSTTSLLRTENTSIIEKAHAKFKIGQ